MQPFYQSEESNARKLLIIAGILIVAMVIVIIYLFTANRNKVQQSRISEMENQQLNDEFTSVFRNISNVLELDDRLLGAESQASRAELLATKAALEKQVNDGVTGIKASATRNLPQSVRLNRDNYIKLIEAVMASRSNMELLWSSVDVAARTDMLVARLNTENKRLKSENAQLKSGAAGAGTRRSGAGATALQAALQTMKIDLEACQLNLEKARRNGNVVTAGSDDGKKAIVLFGAVQDLVAKASGESSLTMQRAYLRVSKEILAGIKTSFPDKAGFNQKQTEIDNMLKNLGRY